MIRVKWEKEEMEELVAIYFKHKGKEGADLERDLIALSKQLNDRADRLGIRHDEKFRNLNGLHLQYQCIRYVDTEGREGLRDASKLMYEVVDQYKSQHPKKQL